jgi:hypothetical protein
MTSPPDARKESEEEIAEMMAEAARLDAYFARQSPHLLHRMAQTALLHLAIAEARAEQRSSQQKQQ